MNKQIEKIAEFLHWFEVNELPEETSVLLLAMYDRAEDASADEAMRQVEIKTLIEGYDAELSEMLVCKMIDIPVLKQVFQEALQQVGVSLPYADFLKWRQKNKYDSPFELITLPTEEELQPREGEPADHMKQVQAFCNWMSEKPSRNLTLLLLAQDEINSPKSSFAMGYGPDIATMLAKEMKENYSFMLVVESAFYALDQQASYEEYQAWKDYSKKKN